MRLDAKHKAFKTEEITYLDRKTILLDRMMLRFFRLLRFDGRRDVRMKKVTVTLGSLVDLLVGAQDRFLGFASRPDIAEAWLRSDLLEIMNRGKGDREAVVGPKPVHLNAYKLTAPAAVQDYGASDQLWALLYHADQPLLNRLRVFFGRGLDGALDRYDRSTQLDLQTLAILALVDQVEVKPATSLPPVPLRPLCLGQGRLLADDLRRLLAYEHAVPRVVLAGYIRTVLGLHLALYQLRLLRLVPAVVDAADRGEVLPTCPLEPDNVAAANCTFTAGIVVDLTDDPASGPAQLARQSAESHLARLAEYIRAVFVVNRLKDYATVLPKPQSSRTLTDLLGLLAEPPSGMEGFFQARVADLAMPLSSDEDEDPVVATILAQDISAMDKLVELICKQRLPDERKRMTELIDSLSQKNRPGGFMRQTAGARSPRWFVLGSQLLETLAQIAVVQRDGDELHARPVLIDEFVAWLNDRYGFIVYGPGLGDVPAEDYRAWRDNERAFRERLHQIGFFVDLSDAYNSQTLRPRYEVVIA